MASFADILVSLGFGDDDVFLRAQVLKWLELFKVSRTGAVICDYAPVAQLAAMVAGLPTVQLTNGFDAPPAGFPFFDTSVRGPYFDRLRSKAMASIERTLSIFHCGSDGRRIDLQTFLEWPIKVVDGIAESDPYGPRRDVSYVGPFVGSGHAKTLEFPSENDAPRIFAYLRGRSAAIAEMFAILCSSDAVVRCVWPDAPEAAVGVSKDLRVQVLRAPLGLMPGLLSADVVVNYGSSSVVATSLLAGKPQLILPTDVEKCLFASRIQIQGAGQQIIGPTSIGKSGMSGALHDVLADKGYRERAEGIAARYDWNSLHLAKESALASL